MEEDSDHSQGSGQGLASMTTRYQVFRGSEGESKYVTTKPPNAVHIQYDPITGTDSSAYIGPYNLAVYSLKGPTIGLKTERRGPANMIFIRSNLRRFPNPYPGVDATFADVDIAGPAEKHARNAIVTKDPRTMQLWNDVTETWRLHKSTTMMLQYLGQGRLQHLQLRIRNAGRRPFTPTAFRQSETFKILSRYRNIKDLFFTWDTPWPEIENELRNLMTSQRQGGGHVCTISQPPVQVATIMRWPVFKRNDYFEASKAYFNEGKDTRELEELDNLKEYTHANHRDVLEKQCEIIMRYMDEIWAKDGGDPAMSIARKRKFNAITT